MTTIAGIVLFLFSVFTAFGSYVFIVRTPLRLANLDKLDAERRKYLKQVRDQFGGKQSIQKIGYALACLTFFLFVGGVYLFTGQKGNGIGLRFGLIFLGISLVILGGTGLVAIYHPSLSALFREEERAEDVKIIWGMGAVGIILLVIAGFVY